MFMLVAIITGVITHRRIFKDFFTFRPKKGQRSWLEAHNASGVLALPFHLMITYTGLVTLMYLYMPWGITTAYQGDRDAYFDAVTERTTPAEASCVSAPMMAIAPLMAAAQKNWDGARSVSSFYAQSGTTRFVAGGYTVLSAQLAYAISKNLDASLTGNNLLDKQYYEKVSGAGRQNFYGEPRSAMLTLRARY